MARRGLQNPFSRRVEAQRRAWRIQKWTTLPLLIVMFVIIAIVVIVKGIGLLIGVLS